MADCTSLHLHGSTSPGRINGTSHLLPNSPKGVKIGRILPWLHCTFGDIWSASPSRGDTKRQSGSFWHLAGLAELRLVGLVLLVGPESGPLFVSESKGSVKHSNIITVERIREYGTIWLNKKYSCIIIYSTYFQGVTLLMNYISIRISCSITQNSQTMACIL